MIISINLTYLYDLKGKSSNGNKSSIVSTLLTNDIHNTDFNTKVLLMLKK